MRETNRSDRELVVQFQAGDPAAYDEVYRRYRHKVLATCRRMLGNPQDAEEATQEVFLKAFQALTRFNGEFKLQAWLTRIATNVCVDHLRSRSRSTLVALNADDRDELGAEQSPEDLVVGQHPRLDVAIEEIRPLHAKVLHLRAVQGMSHVEIAGRMEMTPKQVKALLHRARTSLRRAWERAEGWMIAPLFGFRRIVDPRSENASQAGSNFVAVSPAMPMFAERVATSAAMVAIALTAFPSGSVATPAPSAPVRTAATDVVVVGDQMVPKRDLVVAFADDQETDAEEEVALETPVADVLDTLNATLKGTSKHRSGDGSDGDDGDDDGGSIPVRPAGANEIVRQAKEELNRLPIPQEGIEPLK